MKRARKIYGIGVAVFFGWMMMLTIFVWYQRAVNTPVVNFIYPHQGTIKAPAHTESKGEAYQVCLPTDVLDLDARGYFVYVVEARQGILGNTNIAVKRRIEVLAMDDSLAAVEGNLTAIDKVISDSDKEIYDGCPILLQDSGI